jgi:hypothetical protein
MASILIRLAVVNFCVLLAAFAIGGVSWLRGGLHDQHSDVYLLHFSVGLFAIILNLGLHCLIFIYFLGTGRWVKEVALAYQLPDVPLPKLTRDLKRQTFPPALLAMLVPIGVAAAGMANHHGHGLWFAPLHLGLAVLTLLVNLWACRIAYRNVRINTGVIDEVVREVERIRAERGLPPSAEELGKTDPV